MSTRRPLPFSASLFIHGGILGWVAFQPLGSAPQKSLYEIAIKPHEEHLIYYKLTDRLPDVKPSNPTRDARPERAKYKFPQHIVAGAKDDSRPPQLIFAPAPEVPVAKPQPLPNLIAVTPAPRLVRPFVAPKIEAPTIEAPATLPDAPKVATARTTAAELPVVPAPTHPPALPFKPPPLPRGPEVVTAALPAAPEIHAEVATGNLPTALSKAPRSFVAPPKHVPTAPAQPVLPSDAPSLQGVEPSAQASLAIVGLDPSKLPDVPKPPSSRAAAFSAGPKLKPKGGEGASEGAMLEVPSLMISGGAKEDKPVLVARTYSPTSPEGLAAAMRAAPRPVPPPSPNAGRTPARVSNAPDPRLDGRVVYAMAIQMPNVTSYSGSWMIWFAEHEQQPGAAPIDIKAPEPLHKVDPKYIASAMYDRVEGKVRLWCTIGKDGHVGSVTLLSHLDDRLDRSAQEALAKWIFQPALANGIPVELDAIFEVPFKLAPRPIR